MQHHDQVEFTFERVDDDDGSAPTQQTSEDVLAFRSSVSERRRTHSRRQQHQQNRQLPAADGFPDIGTATAAPPTSIPPLPLPAPANNNNNAISRNSGNVGSRQISAQPQPRPAAAEVRLDLGTHADDRPRQGGGGGNVRKRDIEEDAAEILSQSSSSSSSSTSRSPNQNSNPAFWVRENGKEEDEEEEENILDAKPRVRSRQPQRRRRRRGAFPESQQSDFVSSNDADELFLPSPPRKPKKSNEEDGDNKNKKKNHHHQHQQQQQKRKEQSPRQKKFAHDCCAVLKFAAVAIFLVSVLACVFFVSSVSLGSRQKISPPPSEKIKTRDIIPKRACALEDAGRSEYRIVVGPGGDEQKYSIRQDVAIEFEIALGLAPTFPASGAEKYSVREIRFPSDGGFSGIPARAVIETYLVCTDPKFFSGARDKNVAKTFVIDGEPVSTIPRMTRSQRAAVAAAALAKREGNDDEKRAPDAESMAEEYGIGDEDAAHGGMVTYDTLVDPGSGELFLALKVFDGGAAEACSEESRDGEENDPRNVPHRTTCRLMVHRIPEPEEEERRV